MLSRRLLATAAIALLAPAFVARAPRRAAGAGLPSVMLWAWERPDDLRRLPPGIGVAFLAQTITLAGGAHVVSRRRQPLQVSDGTPMMAVTRIEAAGDVDAADVPAIARTIADRGRLPMVAAVQIDFDARVSQREMYRRLLHQVRAALPSAMPMSMTALTSWCLDDNWLDELPVDEAVPMLFRMGPAEQTLRREWPRRMPAAKCRGAIGVALDEPAPPVRRGTRVYVFNASPWEAHTIAAAVETTR